MEKQWQKVAGSDEPIYMRSKDKTVMGIMIVGKKKEVRTKTGLKPGDQEEEKMKVVKESWVLCLIEQQEDQIHLKIKKIK